MNKKLLITVALTIVFFICNPYSFAEAKGANLKAVELLSGYGTAKIVGGENFKMVPFFLNFDYDLKSLGPKKWSAYPGLLQLIVEPFVSYVYEPRDNLEAGIDINFKIGLLPQDRVVQPYLKVGIGGIYLSQHFRNQYTQLNFTEFAGVGVHYFIKKDTALTAEYRYRHISNASIDQPNSGINTSLVIFGISCFF